MSQLKVFDNIIIDSKDRDSGTTSDFLIRLPSPDRKPRLVEITSIIFPYVFDTVDSSNNQFKIGGVTYTIPVGHYDINSLIVQCNTTIGAVGTFSFTSYGRISLTLAAPAIFDAFTADRLLGYTSSPYIAATNFIAEDYPNLTEDSDYLTLSSRNLDKYGDEAHIHTDKRSFVLCTIPLTEAYGSIITWQPQQRLLFRINDNRLDEVDFYLRDQGNRAIDLGRSSFSINITRYSYE